MTKYTFRRCQTVTVEMADEGDDYEGEPVHWETPTEQEEAARDWTSQAFLDEEDFCEDFMKAECSPWKNVSAEDSSLLSRE